MWARRRLRVVLDGKNRVLPVLDSFDGPVVEVKVGDLKRLRARNLTRLSPYGESMILGRDKYLSCRKIPYWMVAAAVSVWELHRLATHGQAEQLMAEADAKDWQLPIRQRANCIDRVPDGRGVAGAVRQKHAVRFQRACLGRGCRRRDHRDPAAMLYEQPQDVALHPEVERDDMMFGALGSLAVRAGNRRGAREIESVHRRRCRESGVDHVPGLLAQRQHTAQRAFGADVPRELPRIDVGD